LVRAMGFEPMTY